jgi:hypothetical protein
MVESHAESGGEDFEKVKQDVMEQLKKESANRLFHDPEGMEPSEEALRVFNQIKADGDLIEDRREYQVDDLKSAYNLKWSDAIDLHNLIQNEFDQYYRDRGN